MLCSLRVKARETGTVTREKTGLSGPGSARFRLEAVDDHFEEALESRRWVFEGLLEHRQDGRLSESSQSVRPLHHQRFQIVKIEIVPGLGRLEPRKIAFKGGQQGFAGIFTALGHERGAGRAPDFFVVVFQGVGRQIRGQAAPAGSGFPVAPVEKVRWPVPYVPGAGV